MRNQIKRLIGIAGCLALALSVGVPTSSAQQCEPIETEMNVGCAGCITTVSMNCFSAAGECNGCDYIWTSAISCNPPVVEILGGAGNTACDDTFEQRFGGCGGMLWGWVVCQCLACP